MRMCDSLGVPLVVLVDVPGYLPGLGQEWDGVVRRGAKLLHAFAEAVVPRVTLVTRKAYGGAYIAMNSRSLGATAVFAWPNAEVAVMGASAAVNILHRKKLAAAPAEKREELRAQLIEEQMQVAGGVNRALEIGVVDDVITPGRDPPPHRRGPGRRPGRPRRPRQHPPLAPITASLVRPGDAHPMGAVIEGGRRRPGRCRRPGRPVRRATALPGRRTGPPRASAPRTGRAARPGPPPSAR